MRRPILSYHTKGMKAPSIEPHEAALMQEGPNFYVFRTVVALVRQKFLNLVESVIAVSTIAGGGFR